MYETTNQIINIEWDLFDKVQNIGGRAGCQDDREPFFLMRSSQLDAWTEEMRRSWLDDLCLARAEGRNPLAEKYGYMMERTDSVGYASIANSLPSRTEEKMALVTEICAAHLSWILSLRQEYPLLTGRGRAVNCDADSLYSTSFTTYLAGELSTYSEQTLSLYLAYVRQLQKQGKNLNKLILNNTITQYGYASLDAAEAALAVH